MKNKPENTDKVLIGPGNDKNVKQFCNDLVEFGVDKGCFTLVNQQPLVRLIFLDLKSLPFLNATQQKSGDMTYWNLLCDDQEVCRCSTKTSNHEVYVRSFPAKNDEAIMNILREKISAAKESPKINM